MHSLLLAAALLVTLTAPVAVVLADAPHRSDPVLIIAPSSASAQAIVRAAGGQVIGPFSAPFASLAYSDDPDFVENLYRSGAWAVRGGQRLVALCGVA